MTNKIVLERPKSLGRLLNISTAACNALGNEMLSKDDLTIPQWVILSALWRKNGMLVSELAGYTNNDNPAASRIVDRMVDKGLLIREVDTKDRRAVRVSLTEKSEGLRHLHLFYQDLNDNLLDGIEPAKAELLFELLNRVMENAQNRQQQS